MSRGSTPVTGGAWHQLPTTRAQPRRVARSPVTRDSETTPARLMISNGTSSGGTPSRQMSVVERFKPGKSRTSQPATLGETGRTHAGVAGGDSRRGQRDNCAFQTAPVPPRPGEVPGLARQPGRVVPPALNCVFDQYAWTPPLPPTRRAPSGVRVTRSGEPSVDSAHNSPMRGGCNSGEAESINANRLSLLGPANTANSQPSPRAWLRAGDRGGILRQRRKGASTSSKSSCSPARRSNSCPVCKRYRPDAMSPVAGFVSPTARAERWPRRIDGCQRGFQLWPGIARETVREIDCARSKTSRGPEGGHRLEQRLRRDFAGVSDRDGNNVERDAGAIERGAESIGDGEFFRVGLRVRHKRGVDGVADENDAGELVGAWCQLRFGLDHGTDHG